MKINPDLSRGSAAESEPSEDPIIPDPGDLPIVGLGGSAGSLPALQAFFAAQKPDTGMAFIVIVHLSPHHDSLMADILQRSTSMPVRQVQTSLKVEPNHVYVIPPGRHLTMVNGHLDLLPLTRERGTRVAIDLFFRTLAETHGASATAVVLSGKDSDGTIGIKRIKERGGLTIAQDPKEAEIDEMPRSAIKTEMIDWILRVSEIPRRLEDFWRLRGQIALPKKPPEDSAAIEETALREILAFVRTRTGRDFSDYKRATVLRRLARRMQVNSVLTLSAYYSFLGMHPGECGALVQDLLVSVTNFFRDRDAFGALEQMLADLFRGKTSNDTVRVWVPACATGEEAYSIAILLNELAARLESPPKIQIFATDLDAVAVAAARLGRFTATISADVSPERLQRFFLKEDGGYRIQEFIREQVLFVVHDLLHEAPFSRLDLVSCRNLLIYLNRDAQRRIFDTFHFALNRGAILFLGSSETAEEFTALFDPVDRKHRLFRRLETSRGAAAQMVPLPNLITPSPGKVALPRPIAPPSLESGVALARLEIAAVELHSRLLETLNPPSIVLNRDHQIVHLSNRAGRFLQWRGGEPTSDILELLPSEIRSELRAALLQASQTQTPVEIEGSGLGKGDLRLRVQPASEISSDFLLLLFIEDVSGRPLRGRELSAGPDSLVQALERELSLTKHQLRGVLEQHSLGMEEMKASNEELHAMNEELRSASEELETGREELQSINEELQTVNLELKTKVDEVARANNDLQTLMASTAIPTVFLDATFKIKRYTPAAVDLFNMIPTDIGRPFSDLRSQIEYPGILVDAEKVLRDLIPVQREVRSLADRHFLARITVYRTVDRKVEGVVLTLVDITDRKKMEADLREARDALRQRADELEKTVELRTSSLREAVGELEHFSYALTHDMRAPLRAMRSFAELLGDDALPQDDRREYARRIQIASQRLDQLITDSLHYSQTSRAHLPLEPVSLDDLLRDLKDTYPNLHHSVADITVDPLPVVLGNRAGLTQCFGNLIGNAVKFAKPGERPTIRIWPETAKEPDAESFVRIWVSDQGIGIPAQSIDRIFGLFQRATDRHEGTGLGLAIVRKVVSKMGGRVGVFSEEGMGTRFWVELQKAHP